MNGLVLKLRASGIRLRTYDIVEVIEIALTTSYLMCVFYFLLFFFHFFFRPFYGLWVYRCRRVERTV